MAVVANAMMHPGTWSDIPRPLAFLLHALDVSTFDIRTANAALSRVYIAMHTTGAIAQVPNYSFAYMQHRKRCFEPLPSHERRHFAADAHTASRKEHIAHVELLLSTSYTRSSS